MKMDIAHALYSEELSELCTILLVMCTIDMIFSCKKMYQSQWGRFILTHRFMLDTELSVNYTNN